MTSCAPSGQSLRLANSGHLETSPSARHSASARTEPWIPKRQPKTGRTAATQMTGHAMTSQFVLTGPHKPPRPQRLSESDRTVPHDVSAHSISSHPQRHTRTLRHWPVRSTCLLPTTRLQPFDVPDPAELSDLSHRAPPDLTTTHPMPTRATSRTEPCLLDPFDCPARQRPQPFDKPRLPRSSRTTCRACSQRYRSALSA